MALESPNMPAFYEEAPVERIPDTNLPEPDIAAIEEPMSPRRSSREHGRGTGGAESLQSQPHRTGSLRSNPPTSWRLDGQATRGDDYTERRSQAKPTIVADKLRSEKRSGTGSRTRHAEPALSETAETDFARYPKAQTNDRFSGQYGRYANDHSDAERGYGARSSQDSRKADEHPSTEDSEKPFNDEAQPMPSRPGPFGRTFTQKFSAADPGPTMDFKNMSRADRREVIKLPWYQLMESDLKNHIVAALGELIGTTMFLFFAFAGTAVAAVPAGTGGGGKTSDIPQGFSIEVQMYIALSFGFSLMVNVWIFYRISGGLFNPAVTMALLLVKVIPPSRAAFVFVAQLAGGIAAAGLASAMFPTTLSVRTKLSAGTSLAQGFFIELVLTFELVFTIFMLAAEKHKARFIAPVGIGLALFIAELTGVYYTGGSLNPARSFGPCVIAADFNSEHWIYWVGPLAGSACAVVLYKAIKVLQYERVNPGQDLHK